MYDAIQKLWKLNYAAIQLYKEILDVAKERLLINDFNTSQKLVYAIIDRVEHYLENSDFDITNYEKMINESYDFIHNLDTDTVSVVNLKESLMQNLDLWSNSQSCKMNYSLQQSKSNKKIFEKAKQNENLNTDLDNLNDNKRLSFKDNLINDHPDLAHEKSRNPFKGSLSSKNYDDLLCTATHLIKDQRSMKIFHKKVFFTEDANRRKKAKISKLDLQVPEPNVFEDEIGKFIENYKTLQNEINDLANNNPNLKVDNKVIGLACDNEFANKIKPTILDKIELSRTKNCLSEAKIDKLLENLSIMILSKQHVKDIDQESCDFIQKMFGNKALIKILKHIDTSNWKSGDNKTTSKKQMQAYKKSLLELRKFMMQIEMNVNSRDNFLIDENEAETTQNLFIKSLSIVDKIIMSIRKVTVNKSISRSKINECSTNKSNTDWETKSLSCDKTIFDIDSNSMIQPEFAVNKKTDLGYLENTELGILAINQKHFEDGCNSKIKYQSQKDWVSEFSHNQDNHNLNENCKAGKKVIG